MESFALHEFVIRRDQGMDKKRAFEITKKYMDVQFICQMNLVFGGMFENETYRQLLSIFEDKGIDIENPDYEEINEKLSDKEKLIFLKSIYNEHMLFKSMDSEMFEQAYIELSKRF